MNRDDRSLPDALTTKLGKHVRARGALDLPALRRAATDATRELRAATRPRPDSAAIARQVDNARAHLDRR